MLRSKSLNFRTSTFPNFVAPPHAVFRTRPNIARDSTEYFVFVFVTDGEMFFNQLARCGTLKAGHYVMLRSGEPYELSCLSPSRAFTVHLPISDILERYRLAHLHCAKAFESAAALFPMAAAVISSIGAVPVRRQGSSLPGSSPPSDRYHPAAAASRTDPHQGSWVDGQ